MISAMKDSELMAKQAASEVSASRRPATGGPMNRPVLNNMALSASALGRSAGLPTKRPIKDCRKGASKLLTSPSNSDMTTSNDGVTRFFMVRKASRSACNASTDCTPISQRRLSCLSIHAPASGPMTSCGISAAKVVIPSNTADPVRRYTSHDMATCWIHDPRMEIA